jgi:hypothetical protein
MWVERNVTIGLVALIVFALLVFAAEKFLQ